MLSTEALRRLEARMGRVQISQRTPLNSRPDREASSVRPPFPRDAAWSRGETERDRVVLFCSKVNGFWGRRRGSTQTWEKRTRTGSRGFHGSDRWDCTVHLWPPGLSNPLGPRPGMLGTELIGCLFRDPMLGEVFWRLKKRTKLCPCSIPFF